MTLHEFGVILLLVAPVGLILSGIWIAKALTLVGWMADTGMQPSILPTDRLFLCPILRRHIRRGRTVVYARRGRREGAVLNRKDGLTVRRVVGLPGERVEIRGGRVFIDGRELKGDRFGPTLKAGMAKRAITLGPDEYFLLCDNRDNTRDSRRYGPVDRSQIGRRVIGHVSPFSRRCRVYLDIAKHYGEDK